MPRTALKKPLRTVSSRIISLKAKSTFGDIMKLSFMGITFLFFILSLLPQVVKVSEKFAKKSAAQEFCTAEKFKERNG
jgi:Na+-transporting methylmalonyl-CoA/oxaloacetate decarboxylase gamma subunit